MMDQKNEGRRPWFLIVAVVCLVAVSAAAEGSPAVDAHESLACDSCHMRTAGFGSGPRIDESRCLRCHDTSPKAAPAAAAFHRSDAGCATCHSFHRPSELRAVDATFEHDFGNPDLARHCNACHGTARGAAGLNEAHRAAAKVYHGNADVLARLTPSEGCLLCHSKHDADPTALRMVSTTPRFNEHASHPYGAVVAPGRSTGGFRIRRDVDPRLPLYDGRMECATCHDITDDAPDLLVRYESPTDLCMGCHRRTPGADMNVAAATDPAHRPAERPIGLAD